MRSGRTQEQLNSLAHRQYAFWATGDGATTEFPLGKSVLRLDDLTVTVAGLVKRVANRGTAFDYQVRGLTPGYVGDRNRVRFSVAPVAAADIGFFIDAD